MRVLKYLVLWLALMALVACTTGTPTPAPVTLSITETSAPAELTPSGPSTEAALTAEPAATVPAPTGTFTYGFDTTQTSVSYSVEETFINEDNRLAIAVGKTRDVQGTLTLNFDDPANSQFGEFSVNISTLRSDSRRRDEAIKTRWLESATYPTATFVVKGMEGFPANPQPGQEIAFKLLGDLTVRTGTQAVTWDVTAKLDGDKLVGTATTFIMMADFGVEPPSIGGILNVKDGVTLTLEFVMLPTQ